MRELIELKVALRRSATDVETLLIWQENVQRSFGVSLARVIDIILEQIFARVKIEIGMEMMEIEDHQEDIEIEEDLQTMIEEEDLRVMVVTEIGEEDLRVMVVEEDHQGDIEMTDIDLRVQKENMILQEESKMTRVEMINHLLIKMIMKDMIRKIEELPMMIEDILMMIKRVMMRPRDTQTRRGIIEPQ